MGSHTFGGLEVNKIAPTAPMAALPAPGWLAAAHHSGARSLRLIAAATDAGLPSCHAWHLHSQRLKLPAALLPGLLLPAIHTHCNKNHKKRMKKIAE
jgi:hypothetical protein